MHHNLDIHPIPEKVLYINEMDFLEPNYYELKEQKKQLQEKQLHKVVFCQMIM